MFVFGEQLAVGVLFADGTEGGWRGKQCDYAVLRGDAPKRAGIWGADRFALVEDRGAAVEQRRIDDIAMADHPADLGSRPPDVACIDAVEMLHRPLERDHVAAIVTYHTLRHAGRARRVQDVERISSGDGHTFARLGVIDRVFPHLAPVVIPAGREHRLTLRTLQDHTGLRLVFGDLDRLVEQRLVGNDARDLDAAASRQNDLRLWVRRPG